MFCSMMSKKNRQWMLRLFLALGVVSLAFGLVGARLTPESEHSTMRLMGMVTGFGTGIVLVAVIVTIREHFVKPEKLEQEKIEAQDERNVALNRAALSVAAAVAILVFAALAFVLTGMGYSTAGLLCIVGMYVEVIGFVIARAVLSKRM